MVGDLCLLVRQAVSEAAVSPEDGRSGVELRFTTGVNRGRR